MPILDWLVTSKAVNVDRSETTSGQEHHPAAKSNVVFFSDDETPTAIDPMLKARLSNRGCVWESREQLQKQVGRIIA